MGHDRIPALSERQRQCLQGVAEHLDSQQIAERLGIRPRTVDNHLAAAMATLGASTRRDAVRKWLEHERNVQATSIPLPGEFLQIDDPAVPPSTEGGSRVREPSVPMSLEEPLAPLNRRGGNEERPKNALRAIAIITGLAAALAIMLLAVPQLARDAQSLANLIQPYHQHR